MDRSNLSTKYKKISTLKDDQNTVRFPDYEKYSILGSMCYPKEWLKEAGIFLW